MFYLSKSILKTKVIRRSDRSFSYSTISWAICCEVLKLILETDQVFYVREKVFLKVVFKSPTLIVYSGVTNAHGPSPQLTACRPSSCILTTATVSNQA